MSYPPMGYGESSLDEITISGGLWIGGWWVEEWVTEEVGSISRGRSCPPGGAAPATAATPPSLVSLLLSDSIRFLREALRRLRGFMTPPVYLQELMAISVKGLLSLRWNSGLACLCLQPLSLSRSRSLSLSRSMDGEWEE